MHICNFKTLGCVLVAKMEQQNSQVVEVGRHLWRSPGPTCLLKQDHLELVAQEQVQMGFDCL